ncbi:flippase-like domain-containing protein [Candidatus Woesearchaeota archaeon]|nr:flippase-like domain-containing protein [Candidatus Woesearchaeota archaeon]
MELRKVGKLALALLISLVLLWLIFQQIQPTDIVAVYQQIPLSLIVSGFFLFGISHLIRTFRFQYLLGRKISFHDLFAVVCMHNILLALLPFRMGEFSIPYFLKKRNIKVTESLGMLAVGRIFDILAIILLFFFSLLMVWNELPAFLQGMRLYALILFVLLVLFIYFTVSHLQPLLRKWNNNQRTRTVALLLEKAHEIAESFQILRKQHGITIVFCYTIIIWILQFTWTYIVFSALLQSNLWIIIIGSALPILATAIPIQGVGNFGTWEGVWGVTFMAFGLEQTLAFASGFVFHILNILYALGMALYGLVVFYGRR